MRWLFLFMYVVLGNSISEAAFLSAGDLRTHCNAKLSDRAADFQICLWYIGALHDALQDAGEIRGVRACFPSRLIVGDLIDPVVRFIDTLPNPDRFGAAGSVLTALGKAYPCTEKSASRNSEPNAVEMKVLRPNVKDFSGKLIRTSGFIRCIATFNDCQVEPTAFGATLMPYLYFDANALTSELKTDFYAKCARLCYFEGIVSVKERYGEIRLQPSQVTFDNSIEKLRP
jgi:hypothetical protein